MQRSNLKVMVRPRRLPEGGTRGSIRLDKYSHEIEMTNNMFQYDVVFDEDASQEEVYESMRGSVEKLVEGYSVGILAYGQTSSGKTYTVGTNGVEECYVKNPGIISRAASDIFRLAVPRDETTQINVKVTFMEIYNEQAFDLLHVDDKKKPVIKKVRDVPRKDRPGELVTDVEGLITETVDSTQAVMDILHRGSKNRRVASTTMNANSSRSHAVFTMFVEHLNDEGESTLASTPYLQLVDLAGSEIPEGDKTTMKEGVNINKSLSALGRVIIQLRDRSGHVSYRDSVLTRVLKPLLDGNSITTLIACVSMEACNEAESKRTLHYAQQARKIEISAQKAQKSITREEFLKLKEENRRLKKLCANHNIELDDLEMTIMELEEEKEKEPFGTAARTEEMIQILVKYEASTKTVEMLQERCNQLQRLVEMLSKKLDRSEAKAGIDGTPLPTEPCSPNRTFSLNGSNQMQEDGDHTDEEGEEPRDELALVSALSVLDQDYDENASQLKYFIDMQKKSAQLEEKVLELEKQLEASEAEKASTAKQMSTSKKSSTEFKELQNKLEAQTEKNRVLQEKLCQLKKDLKSSQVQSETIEKYKAKVDSINRERVKLQRMLKEQGKKSQEEIKRQKREMIALQRQQQRAANERTKLDAKLAAERRCQQRKLEQALAAKDRLEMLLKRKTESNKMATKQQSASNKNKTDTTTNTSVYSKVKEMVDDEVNMAATRALSSFYVNDYTKQIQTFSDRMAEIDVLLESSDLDENTRLEVENERQELLEKIKNAQLVVDKNQEVQKTAEGSGKLHEKFTTISYDAQLTIKLLVSKCEKLAYKTAEYRDELATLTEQQQHTQQLLKNCEHDKQLAEEKYAEFIVGVGRDEGNREELEKAQEQLKEREKMIDELKSKLNEMSHGMMIPRSPFTVAPLNPRRTVLHGRSVAVRRLDALRMEEGDASILFSEDEKSFNDNKDSDPDWVANLKGQRAAKSSLNSQANTSGASNTSNTEGRSRKLLNYEADNENEEPPNKKKSEGGSVNGCRCSGGKSCQKCKCTKAGATCSVLCKCAAQCLNAPIQTDDIAQRIPAAISNMMESVENQKLY